MGASVPSGRAEASASWADPYRPMPSPATTFKPASSLLWKRGKLALAPRPPEKRESLYAPAAPAAFPFAVGDVAVVAAQVTDTGTSGAGVLPAVVPMTAQG